MPRIAWKALMVAGPLLAAGLASCSPAKAPPTPHPVAAVPLQLLLTTMVTPASEDIWNLPPVIADPDAAKTAKPEDLDAAWANVRRGAVALVEVSNLIALEGRTIVPAGVKIAREGEEGNLRATEIQALFVSKRPELLSAANGLQAASLKVLAAADKRDGDALLDAGGKVEEACEACHQTFWYPNAPK